MGSTDRPSLRRWLPLFMLSCGYTSVALAAQPPIDRATPSLIERQLPNGQRDAAPPEPAQLAPSAPEKVSASGGLTASSIVIDGNTSVSVEVLRKAVLPFAARPLSRDDLRSLARVVAGIAREQGYVFATATVPAQPMKDNVLHVTLDEGRIDATRVLGTANAEADRLLAKLISQRPVQRKQLEKTLLLIGDLPGVIVKQTQYLRQDGFGVLLVTISQSRSSGYAQVDNRGSKEIGPVRSVLLYNFTGLIKDGDEAGVLTAQSPLQPRELMLGGAHYTLPLGDGDTLTLAGSYVRTKAGGDLRKLNVAGHSVEVSLTATHVLLRSRERSLGASMAIRSMWIDQSLRDLRLQNDHLVTLTGSLSGDAKVAGGMLHSELSLVGGLPFPGVTRNSDSLKSRLDGDGRFVLAQLSGEWLNDLTSAFSLRLAALAQIASRPLLSTMEIGFGGAAFGRGFDYSERSGDNGVLGAAELRYAFRGRPLLFLDRTQIYGFVDGGIVTNLEHGSGGGGLSSAGAGVRLGHGVLEIGVEAAFPILGDNSDSDLVMRSPRLSVRIARRL